MDDEHTIGSKFAKLIAKQKNQNLDEIEEKNASENIKKEKIINKIKTPTKKNKSEKLPTSKIVKRSYYKRPLIKNKKKSPKKNSDTWAGGKQLKSSTWSSNIECKTCPRRFKNKFSMMKHRCR